MSTRFTYLLWLLLLGFLIFFVIKPKVLEYYMHLNAKEKLTNQCYYDTECKAVLAQYYEECYLISKDKEFKSSGGIDGKKLADCINERGGKEFVKDPLL